MPVAAPTGMHRVETHASLTPRSHYWIETRLQIEITWGYLRSRFEVAGN
jgi:hypothetical protein